ERPTDYRQAIDWFTVERPALLAAVDHAAATSLDTHTWQLAWALRVFLDRRGHWHEWTATERAAVAAAPPLADPAVQALTHLTLQQELDNRDGQAGTWDSLGHAHHHLGHHTEAVTCYHRALALYRDLSDRYHEASTLTRLGDTHHTAGNPHPARDAYQRALAI